MPQTKTGPDEMAPTKTVDANGWTVNNMGTFKIYTKKITTTLSGFNGPAFISALQTSLPVGVATLNLAQSVLCSFHYGNSGAMRVVQERLGTDSQLAVVGTTTATFNGTIEANYTMIV